MHRLILIFLSLLIFSSCKKDIEVNLEEDYLVFGHFFGFCTGEACIEIFKLENAGLFEDNSDNYPAYQHAYVGSFNALPGEKYQSVKHLLHYFPIQLLEEKQTILGDPDTRNEGGFYVEVKVNGQKHFWLIDQNLTTIPSYLHSFLEELKTAIEILQ